MSNPPRPRLFLVAAFAVILLGAFAACTVEQEILLRTDGTGSATATVTIDPIVIRYMDAVFRAVGAENAGDIPLFDVTRIVEELDSAPGIEPGEVEIIDRRTLSVQYEITDISRALEGALVRTIGSGGTVKVGLLLDRISFTSVSRLFLDEKSPIAVFVPVARADFLSKSEYRELARYALEDFATGSSVDEILDASMFMLSVRTDGRIVAATGGDGEYTTGRADFAIPLLDLVTLEQPIHISLEWR